MVANTTVTNSLSGLQLPDTSAGSSVDVSANSIFNDSLEQQRLHNPVLSPGQMLLAYDPGEITSAVEKIYRVYNQQVSRTGGRIAGGEFVLRSGKGQWWQNLQRLGRALVKGLALQFVAFVSQSSQLGRSGQYVESALDYLADKQGINVQQLSRDWTQKQKGFFFSAIAEVGARWNFGSGMSGQEWAGYIDAIYAKTNGMYALPIANIPVGPPAPATPLLPSQSIEQAHPVPAGHVNSGLQGHSVTESSPLVRPAAVQSAKLSPPQFTISTQIAGQQINKPVLPSKQEGTLGHYNVTLNVNGKSYAIQLRQEASLDGYNSIFMADYTLDGKSHSYFLDVKTPAEAK